MQKIGEEDEECLSLSQKEINKSLSAQKKKKKTFKPVLSSPFPPPFNLVQEGDGNLINVLKRDLAVARLSNPISVVSIDPKVARAALALGVNAVYRNLHKNNISAVVLAADIQPPSLVSHIILKCHRDAVPLLRINQLRSVTTDSVGFECIALGFLKTSDLFKSAIECVIEQCPAVVNNPCHDSSVVEVTLRPDESHPHQPREPPERKFEYRMRTDPSTRAFVPEVHKTKNLTEPAFDFISISKQDFAIDKEVDRGISTPVLKKRPKLKNFEEEVDELEEATPKKLKKSWVIDDTGLPWMQSYVPARVDKIASNVNRRKGTKKTNNNKGKRV